EWTGPNEVWWAPYDNRPGTNPTLALPDYTPGGLLWPFLEYNMRVFRCPVGIDQVPGSPTFGRELQVSYALNWISNTPCGLALVHVSNGTSQVLFAWEPSNVPACAWQRSLDSPRVPWPFDDTDVPRHYPTMRHLETMNVLYCDGHVAAL